MKDFSKKLVFWYKKNARDLPWRNTRDPYRIWVSEVMLQQTTVNAVIPYYERWIKVFPTVQSVAAASQEKLLREWQGLGYYQRVRNLQKSAQIISSDYQGKIPNNADDLKKLPGFGPYTTGAVLSIAFDKKYPIIDANVRRLVMRQLALRGRADHSQDEEIYHFLHNVMPDKEICFFNQALMELGALICRMSQPLCGKCPVSRGCQAFQKQLQDMIPEQRKVAIEKIRVVALIIECRGCYLIRKRPEKGLLAGLWEFPTVEVKKGESLKKALKRLCVLEGRGCQVSSMLPLVVSHFYTKFQITIYAWKGQLQARPRIPRGYKWATLLQMKKKAMPSGCVKILKLLEKTG
ncbi:MAG: A/G-specific adenine glycosylase [Candidatus Omnitrophota bacterium]